MAQSKNGYISDVDYVPGFYSQTAPLALQYVATLNHIQPPATQQKFRYLELGCGFGRCCTTLAAVHPEAEFVGVDFNSRHTAAAEHDVAAGGLKNVKIITASFKELDTTIGQFDYIVLHGVYSWVAADVRNDILQIAKRHLADRGILLVSYNAMPGWAALQPIRAILHQYASRRTGDSLQRIAEATKYLKYIADNKAKYFEDNPLVADRVEAFLKQNPKYLAHEYLNENWCTFYFHEVAHDFKTVGLDFIGSLPIHENFWDLCVRPEFKELFNTTKDRSVIETHKDFCANTAFRWDLYSKNPQIMPTIEDRLAHADRFCYRLSRNDITFPFATNLGVITANATGPVYEKLAGLVNKRSMYLAEILSASIWDQITPLEVVSALDVGACMGIFEVDAKPLQNDTKINYKTAKLRFNNEFNRQLLANNLLTGRMVTLASEMSGTGHFLNEFNAVIMHEFVERGFAGVADRVTDQIEKAGRIMKQGGVEVKERATKTEILQKLCDAFFTNVLPEFVRVEIVKEAV